MKALLSRRDFLKLLAFSGSAIAVTGGGVALAGIDTTQLELVNQDIYLESLPNAFHDYRVGFLSDIHLAKCTSPQLIRTAVSWLQDQKPDLILLGGDFIWLNDEVFSSGLFAGQDGSLGLHFERSFEESQTLGRLLFAEVAQLLSRLKAPDGVFAIYGNHDRWVDGVACKRVFLNEGIRILVNEVVLIQRGECTLHICGIDDLWTGSPMIPALPMQKAAAETRLILCHNPDFLSYLLEQTSFQFDLGLAGHTHAGQIKLPGIGALHCNISDHRLIEGLYRHPRAQSYTSRGIGVVGIPVRLNCPPEVAILRLKSR